VVTLPPSVRPGASIGSAPANGSPPPPAAGMLGAAARAQQVEGQAAGQATDRRVTHGNKPFLSCCAAHLSHSSQPSRQSSGRLRRHAAPLTQSPLSQSLGEGQGVRAGHPPAVR
jgi:hypothetical protein